MPKKSSPKPMKTVKPGGRKTFKMGGKNVTMTLDSSQSSKSAAQKRKETLKGKGLNVSIKPRKSKTGKGGDVYDVWKRRK